MRTSATLELMAGDTVRIDFGAQLSSTGMENIQDYPAENRSPFLGIIGGIILLAGLGFGVYAFTIQRR